MAKTSTIQVKFEGYDKTFSNINNIAEELDSLKKEVIASEKALASAEFGSDEWNKLSENIVKNKQLIKEFGTAVEESGVASMKDLENATKELNKANEQFIKDQAEIVKQQEKDLSDANEQLIKEQEAIVKSQEDVITKGKEQSDALVDAGVKITQAFVTTTGTILSFAASEEDAQAITAQLAQTMAVADSIEQAYNATKAISEVLTKTQEVAEVKKTAAVLTGTVATEGAAVATTFLGRAINFALGPIGFLIAGVTALVYAYTAFRDKTADAIKKQNELNASIKEFSDETDRARDSQTELNRSKLKDNIEAQRQQFKDDKKAAQDRTTFLFNEQVRLKKLIEELVIPFSGATDEQVEEQRKNLRKAEDDYKVSSANINKITKEASDFEIDVKKDAANQLLDLEIQQLASKEGFTDQLRVIDLEYEKTVNELNARIDKGDSTALKDKEIAYQEYLNNKKAKTIEISEFELGLRQKQVEQELADLALIDTNAARFQEIEIQRAIELDELNTQLTNEKIKSATEYETKLNDINNKAKNSTIVLLKQIKEETKLINDETKQLNLDNLIKDLNTVSEDIGKDEINQLKALSINTENEIDKLNEKLVKDLDKLRNKQGEIVGEQNEAAADALTQRYLTQKDILIKGETELTDIVKENTAKRRYAEELAQQAVLESTNDVLRQIAADTRLSTEERLNANQQLIDQQIAGTLIQEKEELREAVRNKKKGAELDAIKNKWNAIRLAIIGTQLTLEQTIKLEKINEIKEVVTEWQNALQSSLAVGIQIIDLQTSALDAKLSAIDEKRQTIEDKLTSLNDSITQSQSEIATLNTLIQYSEGARRAFLIEGLEREQAVRDDLAENIAREEAAKKGLAEEEKRINKQKEEQQKKADRLQRISTAIAAVATAVQAGLAVASAAAVSNVGAPIVVPLVVAAIAAGIGAVTAIVGSVQKFEDGGELKGPSHDNGGIRGTGRFNNIEVEGGEYIINKESTENNRPLLEAINKQGRFKKFANGGTLEPNILAMNKVVSTSNTVNAIESLGAKELQIAVVDIITGIDRYNNIKLNTKIG